LHHAGVRDEPPDKDPARTGDECQVRDVVIRHDQRYAHSFGATNNAVATDRKS
jgi:hypothetical protein